VTVWLPRNGRDVATWVLTDPPAGLPTVDIGGVSYPMTVDGVKASVRICGPLVDPAPVGDVIITVDTLARIDIGGIKRQDEWIRLIP